jgi:hypothetical protein
MRSWGCGGASGAAGFVFLFALHHANPAWAQSDEDRAGARTMATEGAKAFSEQRWAEAIDLFTRAESLVHAPPHLLFLARARVKLGQLVLAREAYTKIIRESLPPKAPQPFHDAQAAARAELPTIEPRIAMVTVSVSGPDSKSATVTIDGQPLPPAFVGAPKPMDPGEHRIQATGEAVASELVTVNLKEGGRQNVALTLVLKKGATPVAAAIAPAASPLSPSSPPSPSSSPDTAAKADASLDLGTSGKSNGLRYASFAALGVGAVGVGLGTMFAFQSAGKRKDADGYCPDPDHCLVSLRDTVDGLDDEARKAQTMSIIGFAVGGVGVAAGVTMLVLSGKKSEPATTARSATLRPWIGPTSVGVGGTF